MIIFMAREEFQVYPSERLSQALKSLSEELELLLEPVLQWVQLLKRE